MFDVAGVQWVEQNGELVVGTSLVGVVQNGLSQLNGVTNKAHFTVAMIRGLGGNLPEPVRGEFTKQVIFRFLFFSFLYLSNVLIKYTKLYFT